MSNLFSVEGMNEVIETRTGKENVPFSAPKRDPFECNYTRNEVITGPAKINFCFAIACMIASDKEIPLVPVEYVCAVADMLKIDLSQGRLTAPQRVSKHFKEMFADVLKVKDLGSLLEDSQKEVIPFANLKRYKNCIADFPISDLPLQELQEVFNPVKKKVAKKKVAAK